MPTTYKVLGQSNPAATTATTLYTVGAGKSAVVSTITVCNQAAATATFRIAVRVSGPLRWELLLMLQMLSLSMHHQQLFHSTHLEARFPNGYIQN